MKRYAINAVGFGGVGAIEQDIENLYRSVGLLAIPLALSSRVIVDISVS